MPSYVPDENEPMVRRPMLFMLRLMARRRLAVLASVLLVILLMAASIFSVALFAMFLDGLLQGSGLRDSKVIGFLFPLFEDRSFGSTVRMVAGLMIAAEIVKGFLGYFLGRLTNYMQIHVERDLRAMVFADLLRVEMTFINKEKAAKLFTTMHNFPLSASRIANELMLGLPRLAQFAASVFLLLSLDVWLTVISVTMAFLVTFSIGFLSRIGRDMSRDINRQRVQLHQTTMESLQAMRSIRLFAREKYAMGNFDEDVRELQGRMYLRARISSVVGPTYSVLNTIMIAAVLISATFILDTSDPAWPGKLSVFMFIMLQLSGPAAQYAKRRQRIASFLPSLEAVMAYMQREDKTYLPEGRKRFKALKRSIRFDRVGFQYGAEDELVLRDLRFSIKRGTTVALVGGSGAGKSTVVNLLARLHDPTKGRVLIDGVDLRDYQSATWRSRIAVVSQDTFLFNRSALENIRYGRLDASDEEVFEAARQANAHEFIMELPQGYDTSLGDRGVRLSGGQAQRIAIARAILADPEVLILDEATSALDTATEQQVQAALERVSQNRTVVAIAHRLSTVRNADDILVLERGRVVERGTHDGLMAQRGAYWNYVKMQDLGVKRS